MSRCIIFILAMVSGVLVMAPVKAENSDIAGQVKKPVREAVTIRQDTQKEVEAWAGERQKLLAEHERLQWEQKQLQKEKNEWLHKTAAAEKRITSKEKELADMVQISSQIQPFLQEALTWLEQHRSDDLPFLVDERRQRLAGLAGLMEDPEVAVNERFRKVMEALLVEAEYGHTIEVCQETIAVDGESMLVNIFRLGRVSLFYQSPDGKTCGYFDVADAGWRPLAPAHNRAIQTAINIGAKRQPAELLNLPIGKMAIR